MKRFISLIITFSLLLSSLNMVFAVETETQQVKSYAQILDSEELVETLMNLDFETKERSKFENYDAPTRETDENYGKSMVTDRIGNFQIDLPKTINTGVVLFSFDYMADGFDYLSYVRPYNSKCTDNSSDNINNFINTLTLIGENAGFYPNSEGWTANNLVKMKKGEWLHADMWIDLDEKNVYYNFNDKFEGNTGFNENKLTDLAGFYINREKRGENYSIKMDNIIVAAVDRRSFDSLQSKGIKIPSGMKETIKPKISIGEIGNAVYKKDVSIPATITLNSVLLSDIEVEVHIYARTRAGKSVFEDTKTIVVPAMGEADFDFKLPPMEEYGFNDVTLTVKEKSSGKQISQRTYDYSLVRIPEKGTLNPKQGVCVHLHEGGEKEAATGDYKILLDFAAKLGFGAVRGELRWSAYEKTQGVYGVPTHWQNVFEEVNKNNLDFLDIFCFDNSNYYSGKTPKGKEMLEPFTKYAEKWAKESTDVYFKNGNIEFELWNEWNNLGSWFNYSNLPAEDYADFVKYVYPRVKAANPNVKQWGMSTIPVDNEWIKKVLDAGGGDYMDGVSVHPYSMTQAPEYGGNIEKLIELREMLDSYGYEDMPLRATEWGWSSVGVNGYPDEMHQAAYFIRMAAICENYDFFERMDYYKLGTDGLVNTQEQRFTFLRSGLGDVPYGLKPIALAAANYNRLMTGAVADGRIEIGSSVLSTKFKLDDGKDCVIVWNKDDASSQAGLKLGADNAILMDMYGNEETIFSANGQFNLSLSGMPIYLIGEFSEYEGVERCQFNVNLDEIKIAKGSTSELLLSNLTEKDVTYEINAPTGVTYDMTMGNVTRVDFTSGTENTYDGDVIIKAYEGEKLVWKIEIPLVYSPTVDVELNVIPKSLQESNKWQIVLDIYNRSKDAVSGELIFTSPKVLKDKKVVFENIDFGKSTTQKLILPHEIIDERVIEAEAVLKLSNGEEMPLAVKADIESNPYTSGNIKIDGKLESEEWNTESFINLRNGKWMGTPGQYYGGTPNDGGKNDLSGKVYAAWDKEYFYMAAEITDDVQGYDPTYPGHLWRADGIQFAMAPYKGSGLISQFDISLINGEVLMQCDRSPVPSMVGMVDKENYELAIERDGTTTTYELKIPWTTVFPNGYMAERNGTMAITLLVNDNDGNGRKGYLEYGSGMGSGSASSAQYKSYHMLANRLIDDLQ